MVPYLPWLVSVSLGLLLFLTYVGVRAYQAARSANDAAAALTRVEAALVAGDIDQARAESARATALAAAAENHTGGIAWTMARQLPGVRGPLHTAETVTTVLDDVASAVVAPVVRLPAADVGSRVQGTTVDTAALNDAAPVVNTAYARLKADIAKLQDVQQVGLGAIDSRINEAVSRLDGVAGKLNALDVAMTTGSTMLQDGRRYLVLIQNNAESRATGGIVGAYAVMHVDGSRLVIDEAGPNNDLRDAHTSVIHTNADFDRRYGALDVASEWRSLNLTPNFPTAASIAARLWHRSGPPKVDGVIAVDPPALADLLRVTGTVRVPGGPALSAGNAVEFLESQIYTRYPRSADRARNRYLADVTKAVFNAVQERHVSGAKLVRVLADAVSSDHIQLWSAHADEESRLAPTRIAGDVGARRAPFLEVVTQNLTGGKVDYYLRRRVTYTSTTAPTRDNLGAGPVDQDDAVVTVQLTNTAPADGLPGYVTTRVDREPHSQDPVGTDRLWVSLYFAAGTGYTQATLDGVPIALHTDVDSGTSVMSTVLEFPPDQTHTLVVHVLQPAPAGVPFQYYQQPLAFADAVAVTRH